MNFKRNYEKDGHKWCTICMCYVKKCRHTEEKRGPSYNMGYEEFKGLK